VVALEEDAAADDEGCVAGELSAHADTVAAAATATIAATNQRFTPPSSTARVREP
jgi:hypothetical protein